MILPLPNLTKRTTLRHPYSNISEENTVYVRTDNTTSLRSGGFHGAKKRIPFPGVTPYDNSSLRQSHSNRISHDEGRLYEKHIDEVSKPLKMLFDDPKSKITFTKETI